MSCLARRYRLRPGKLGPRVRLCTRTKPRKGDSGKWATVTCPDCIARRDETP